MNKARKPALSKPALSRDAIKALAEGPESVPADTPTPEPPKSKSGLVPEGHKRLTVNISLDLHKRLKKEAAERECTMGELVANLIARNIPG